MAETGRRVLMVDADLRAPRLHGLFRMDRKQGLSDIYNRDLPIDRVPLGEYVKDTNIPNLSLLSSGEFELQKLGEMFFSRRIRELFSRLRNEYDFVLVDTAPTLQFSDARLLGQISDGLILIIRSGKSSRENVQLTVQRITEDGIPIVGTILNHWQPTQHGGALDDYFLEAYDSEYGIPRKNT
jgi:capsular exopolysaccharide synthesis family protein